MIKRIFLCSLLLMVLTGCVKGSVDIEFIDEKNSKLSIEVLFQEELLNSYDSSITSLKHKLTNSVLSNWQIKDLNQNIKGQKYSGFKLIAPKEVEQFLLTYLSKPNQDSYQLIIKRQRIKEMLNQSEFKDINIASINQLQTMGLELNLNIKMPGTIKETNYGKVNNNQVTINLLDLIKQPKVTEIKIVAAAKHQTNIFKNIIIFLGLIFLLYLVLRKKD